MAGCWRVHAMYVLLGISSSQPPSLSSIGSVSSRSFTKGQPRSSGTGGFTVGAARIRLRCGASL